MGASLDTLVSVISGGTVVTMDAQRRVIEDGAVAIRGDSIAAVGAREEIEKIYPSAKVMDAGGMLVLPGLINGHAHAAMSLFRGIADDHALDTWLHKYIFPAEAHNVTRDFVEWGTKLGILEMLRGGITTFADMYYFEDVVAQATKDAGMRGVLGQTIVDFPSPDHKTTELALGFAQEYIAHWKNDPLITAAVAPHSLYTLTEQHLLNATSTARKNSAPILMHVAEASFETDLTQTKFELSPVAYLQKIEFLGPDVVAAHCIWLDAADIAAFAHHGVGCIHNPSSNMKLASGVMRVADLLAAGVPVGLATDGAASNNRQDIFQEMGLAGKLQKVTSMDPRALPAQQIVEMATIGGAKALHLDGKIGSLEAGKQADLILVDTTAPHATPMYNVYSQLVYALKSSDVKTVVIAGKTVMENCRMLTLDEEKILARACEYQKKIVLSLTAALVT